MSNTKHTPGTVGAALEILADAWGSKGKTAPAEQRGAGAAVSSGVLRHVSASQIKTFQRCERKWWFEKVAGLRPDSTGAQSTGTAVHKEMEDYYLEGKLPAHRSALKAVESGQLPPRASDILVEAAIAEPEVFIEGVKYKGFIDLTIPPNGDGTVRILDWKTTSSWQYCKTEEELRRDVQLGSYGFWARQKYPAAKKLKLAHVYLMTRKDSKGAFRIVEVEASWKDVYRVWGDIVTSVYLMKDTAQLESFEEVEPNWEACEDYGGCAFFSKCHTKAELYDSWEPEVEGDTDVAD